MIKVCHLTSAHDSDDARIFRFECVSLAKFNYETYIVARGASSTSHNVHIVGLGKAPQSRLKRMVVFSRRVYQKALGLNCDIYHLHDPELLPFALKLKRHGKVVVFDSHENTLEQMADKNWIPRPIRKIVAKTYKAYAKFIFKRIDGLISVTPHIVDQLKAINKNTWMITNYPIFVDYPIVSKQINTTSLCFTGGVDHQWSHEMVVESITDVVGVEYNLCGPVNKEYLNVLNKLEGWNKVQFYGKIPFEKAIKVQQMSDIGVALLQPSNNTGGKIGTIGNTKIFEYMMARLPIICTDFVLWKDIVERWACGICVNPNNKEEFIAAVEYLRNHPKEAREMGKNGYKAVKEEYNWGTQERILLQMYKGLINEG